MKYLIEIRFYCEEARYSHSSHRMQPLFSQLAVIVPVLIITLDFVWRLIRGKRWRKGIPLPLGLTQIPLLGHHQFRALYNVYQLAYHIRARELVNQSEVINASSQ